MLACFEIWHPIQSFKKAFGHVAMTSKLKNSLFCTQNLQKCDLSQYIQRNVFNLYDIEWVEIYISIKYTLSRCLKNELLGEN